MKYLAGADIGNSTTEVCLASVKENGAMTFLTGASVPTTGLKGTPDNLDGLMIALEMALKDASLSMHDLCRIQLNEAVPVIGGAVMETITETVVMESSMLGHNPKTPAGFGAKSGKTIRLDHLDQTESHTPYLVMVPSRFSYEEAAQIINQAQSRHISIAGAILQSDEAVLVYNRLHTKIPIVDEVRHLEKITEGAPAAIEVALEGQTIRMLSNPYGIATLLRLTPEETGRVIPIAKSLTGVKSAVVFKTGAVNTPTPARPVGRLFVHTACGQEISVEPDEGADAVMQRIDSLPAIGDARGEPGTRAAALFDRLASVTRALSNDGDTHIRELFAVDMMTPVPIIGALAGETAMEKTIAIAVLVTAGRRPMEKIAEALSIQTGVYAQVSGSEAVMAVLGALTTPGACLPLCVLDIGGGSTDAAYMDKYGECRSICLAGAGELVTMMIQSELGLVHRSTAENIKKYPAARCESLFHLRLENNDVMFIENGLEPVFFGASVLLTEHGLVKIEEDLPVEKIVSVRKESKRKVFVTNALRALRKLSNGGSLSEFKQVILVGGSAEDFEIPEMIAAALSPYHIVCGRGHIRGTEGARNAVATGLAMYYAEG